MADCFKNAPEEIRNAIQNSENKKEALDLLKAENARKRKLVQLTKEKQEKLISVIKAHPKGIIAGFKSVIANDLYGKASNSNIYYRQKALQGVAESFMPTVKEKLSTTKLGFSRDKELGRDFVRAVFGEDASDMAKKLAKEWENASEYMRKRFNQYGGNVGKLKGYLPQSHDRISIQKAGREEWTNFIMPLLKNTDDLDINYVYDTLATGGLNKVKEGSAITGRGKMVANKNADHRVLHFKDAESWSKYQERFGNLDPLAAIDDNIRRMTTDMSMIEILGPNPKNMFEALKLVVDKETTGKKQGFLNINTDAIFNVVSGAVDNDLDSIGKLGPIMQTIRGINTTTMLGGATLSALSDTASLFANIRYNKLNTFRVLKNMLKNFNVKNQEDAIRIGLGADVFNSEVTRRFSEVGEGFWSRASEAMMRATFMNIWTEAARKAFQTEFYSRLSMLRKSYKGGEVPAEFKGRFTKEEFNKINFDNLDPDSQVKILEIVQEETDYAVLNPTARTRSITTAGREKGTYTGEIARTATQFQSFVITFMQQHGARMFMQGTAGSKISYGTNIVVLSTLLGAVSMTMKDISKGWTPREGFDVLDEDVDDKTKVKFWSAAMLQGGGVGIFGDLIFSDATRYGNTPVPTMLGPSASIVEDAYKLTVGNAQEALNPDVENTHFGSEAVDFINRHANPVNTFYTKLIIEQYINRNLKILLDEDYERNEARRIRKREKEYGQEQFEFIQN